MSYAKLEKQLEQCMSLLKETVGSWELALVNAPANEQHQDFELIGCVLGANVQIQKVVNDLKQRQVTSPQKQQSPQGKT